MKKIIGFFILSLLIASNMLGQGTISIKGEAYQADTLEYRQLGPGSIYSRFRLPTIPLDVYLMAIDMNNSYNTVETFQAADQVGKTEAMTQAYNRLSSEGHEVLGGVNANFWIVSGQGQPAELLGVPHSGSIRLGEMVTDPNGWNRGRGETPEDLLQEIGFAVIDENRKVWIDDMGFDGKVTIDGVGDYAISEINRIREANELVFFNSYLGGTTRSDDNGTEVFIKPVSGESWSVNRDITCEVIRIVKDKGSNAIEAGESVLSGTGNAQVFLNNLNAGDRLKVTMGVYTSKDGLRPLAKEMVTGNALVMKDGILTIRNENESYNSQLYSRTGIGTSADGKTLYLIVIDGKGNSKGANTATMCEILKAAGAATVTSMDGGGSAQMMLGGKIVNQPADGKERPVANGWMLFSTAPEDKIPARIAFADYQLNLPAQSSYKPNILVYNKFGALIAENITDFVLTCDPALGQIKDNTTFVANGTALSGKITAAYQGVSATKDVSVSESEVSFRLDSVIIDKRRNYPVEVLAKTAYNTYPVDPSSLTWEIDNPAICQINNGILEALENGTTLVRGRLGDFSSELKVKVQIPGESSIPADDFSVPSSWELKASTNLKDCVLKQVSSASATVSYTYTSGRAPSIRLSKPIAFYGLPDSVKLVFNPHDIALSKVVVSVKPNNTSSAGQIEYNSILANKENIITLRKEDIAADASDLVSYPFHLDYITFFLASSGNEVNKEYTLDIKEFTLIYKDLPPVSIFSEKVFSDVSVFPNPLTGGQLWVTTQQNEPRDVQVEVFTLSGSLVYSRDLGVIRDKDFQLSLDRMLPGSYILCIYQDKKKSVVKLNIK